MHTSKLRMLSELGKMVLLTEICKRREEPLREREVYLEHGESEIPAEGSGRGS